MPEQKDNDSRTPGNGLSDRSQDLKKSVENEKHLVESISSKPSFIYLYKKTEKLAAALYMMTDDLSETEPLKDRLRRSALVLLALVADLRGLAGTEADGLKKRIKEEVMKLVSFLDIGHYTGFFSDMNRAVLRRELTGLLDYLAERDFSPDTPDLDDDFFAVSPPEKVEYPYLAGSSRPASATADHSLDFLGPRPASAGSGAGHSRLSSDRAGHPVSSAERLSDSQAGRDHNGHHNSNGNNGKKGRVSDNEAAVNKNERRAVIFSLLRQKGEVSVADVATVISNCSQKTLQRELLAMVDEGVLKKTGERRWSRYSFAQ